MNDLISRKSALEGMSFSEGLEADGILYVPLRDVRKYLRNLPSVQPEPCVDAVSRKDAIKDVCDALKVAFAIDEDLEEALDIITTTISTLPSVRPDTKFLDFLWNVINPNEMEHYLSMYHSSEGKTDG